MVDACLSVKEKTSIIVYTHAVISTHYRMSKGFPFNQNDFQTSAEFFFNDKFTTSWVLILKETFIKGILCYGFHFF